MTGKSSAERIPGADAYTAGMALNTRMPVARQPPPLPSPVSASEMHGLLQDVGAADDLDAVGVRLVDARARHQRCQPGDKVQNPLGHYTVSGLQFPDREILFAHSPVVADNFPNGKLSEP